MLINELLIKKSSVFIFKDIISLVAVSKSFQTVSETAIIALAEQTLKDQEMLFNDAKKITHHKQFT